MKTAMATTSACALVLVMASSALAQDEGSVEAPPSEDQSSPSTAEQAPDSAQPYAQGEWIYSDQYGWIWVPAGTTPVAVNEQPYVYLYAPVYGWTWFVSPWGWEPFVIGPRFAFRHHFRHFFSPRFDGRFAGPHRHFVGPPPGHFVGPGVHGGPPAHVGGMRGGGGMHGGPHH